MPSEHRKYKYNILIIEDNHGDFTLVEDFLFEQIEAPTLTRATNYKQATEILTSNKAFDIILLDLSLPDIVGEPLIEGIITMASGTPVIVLTGYTDFLFGAKSISMGASDYILKDELTSLSLYKSIIYSFERRRITSDLAQSEKKYSELFHLSPLPMWVFDIKTLQFVDVNRAALNHYGYTRQEFLDMTIRDIRPHCEQANLEAIVANLRANPNTFQGLFIHQKKNGDVINVDVQSNTIELKGRKLKVVLANDVTDRLNYIKAIEEQNEKLKEISWIQSHIVRAPLARMMGLVALIMDLNADDGDRERMMEYLLLSANELDEMIKKITDKTRAADYKLHP